MVARRVNANGPTQVTWTATPAAPELAAAQWSARYGGSPWLYSEPSTRLLARAVAARRLVLVNVEGTGQPRLRGTLATDGTVRAQAERTARAGNLDAESRRLFRDLLVSGKVFEPAKLIYKRAAFWVPLALAVSAAVIARADCRHARAQHSHEGRILRLLLSPMLCLACDRQNFVELWPSSSTTIPAPAAADRPAFPVACHARAATAAAMLVPACSSAPPTPRARARAASASTPTSPARTRSAARSSISCRSARVPATAILSS